jgi:hypothetical protein
MYSVKDSATTVVSQPMHGRRSSVVREMDYSTATTNLKNLLDNRYDS